MAINAQSKSRAASISALVKRDAGFHVQSSSNNRHTGVKIYAGDDLIDGGWPRIFISDPYDGVEGEAEARRKVEYRRYNICKALDKRGYTYEVKWADAEQPCVTIRVGGKAAKGQKVVDGAVEEVHEVKLTFKIDLDRARAYLGDTFRGFDSELGAAMADAINEMIEASVAYDKGAIQVVRNEFIK